MLKVGDRVSVYGAVTTDGGHFVSMGNTGTIRKICTSGFISVEITEGKTVLAHPNQCRRLVKKERRRVWVSAHWLNDDYAEPYTHISPCGPRGLVDPIEFIEVRKKK